MRHRLHAPGPNDGDVAAIEGVGLCVVVADVSPSFPGTPSNLGLSKYPVAKATLRARTEPASLLKIG